VRLNPLIFESPYEYPPPDVRSGVVSGLHCTIPKGMSAPGKVSMLPTLFPPTPVPTKVSTSWLGVSPTGEPGFGADVGDPELGAEVTVGGGAWCGDDPLHPATIAPDSANAISHDDGPRGAALLGPPS
jgi:hypothetical protein